MREIVIKRKNEYANINDLKANKIFVPCRKCYNCQMKSRREDIKRVYDESQYYKYNLFITLTYDNKNIRLIDEVENIYNKYYNSHNLYIQKLIELDRAIKFIRNYDNENKDELKKQIYYYLINKYSTLHYNDITKYLKKIRIAIKRDKNIIDKDFKYYGCGEYPSIKVNRGRPHYHAIYMFNDLKLIKYFIEKWELGNITIERGDNQIDANINMLSNIKLNSKHKLNMICKQESLKDDINRIYEYINNKQVRIETKNNIAKIKYVAGYTNKKAQSLLIESIIKRNIDKTKYFTLKDKNKELEYNELKEILKQQRIKNNKARAEGKTQTEKEDAFIFKSQKLGLRHALNNKDKYINNPTENGRGNKIIIPAYYIKKIIENEEKENIYKANLILYNKNKIVSQLKIDETEKLKKNKNINYEIKRYYDNTIDIIDTTDKNKNINIFTEKLKSIEYEINQKEARERLFGAKEKKSETFINELENNNKITDNNINELIKLYVS